MMPGTIAERPIEQVTGLPLVERRRAGEVFPRIPMQVYDVELTREQAAVALYEASVFLPPVPGNEVLLGVLRRAVREHGTAWLDERLPELEARPREDRDALVAWAWAYRLCLAFWYEDAYAATLDQGQMAAALYASDLASDRRPTRIPDREVSGHLSEGIARLGADRLVQLGQSVHNEFNLCRGPLADGYQAAMPSKRRRKFCHTVAVHYGFDGGSRKPLMVRLADGSHAVGVAPPRFSEIRALVATDGRIGGIA